MLVTNLAIKRGETQQKKLCCFLGTKCLDQPWRWEKWPFGKWNQSGEPKWKISKLKRSWLKLQKL